MRVLKRDDLVFQLMEKVMQQVRVIYLDFVINQKIVVELKRTERYSRSHMDQVLNYLKITDLKLTLLINFSDQEVSFKRILNIS